MALHITDAETERLARELAEVTGETVPRAIRQALREKLERVRQRPADVDLVDDIRKIAVRGRNRPTVDGPSADEILGYDEHGLPG